MFHDPFEHAADSPTAPSENCFAIEPADGEDLVSATKAIYVGEGGDITLRPVRGAGDVTFRNVPSGAILDVRARAVRATGTSASAIVGLA